MFLVKIIDIVILLISWIFGFSILVVFDLIYTFKYSFPNDPIFQHPSYEGIIRGILSVVAYFILMFILYYKKKSKGTVCPRRFIFINTITFISGLVLFFFFGLPLVSPHVINQF
ncbi:hypothetical protein [Clostridium beijerinckii]|uniref:hypothetical protein n=1 Tax=Clostridium beijerinckii TaxID=1520 RepID=UPI00156D7EFE|nr:hypothetical protein [Clostridium beijerinckii]NRT72463.1 uncharacterized membrane protein (DUF485 family) [Clostridium beijerinckii]